jgi:hypothetical protein
MLSHSMATKHISSLLNRNQTLCEINREYPTLKQSVPPRHLCTSTTKSVSTTGHVSTNKLLNTVTTEHHEKDEKEHLKNEKEETELIELFQHKEEDEINNKLYKKHRNQWAMIDDNEDKRDNTN